MTNDSLDALAERCEAATAPDAILSGAIGVALRGFPERQYQQRNGIRTKGAPDISRDLFAADWYPDYTASLDAAMTLVPEGYDPLIDYTGVDTHGGKKIVELYYGPEDREIMRGAASTGPLALCAAALRAQKDSKS